LPFVGGRGTGHAGVFTATLPFVGGRGTGHAGVFTETLPCPGPNWLITFPPLCPERLWKPLFELATATVTATPKNEVRVKTRNFPMNEFI